MVRLISRSRIVAIVPPPKGEPVDWGSICPPSPGRKEEYLWARHHPAPILLVLSSRYPERGPGEPSRSESKDLFSLPAVIPSAGGPAAGVEGPLSLQRSRASAVLTLFLRDIPAARLLSSTIDPLALTLLRRTKPAWLSAWKDAPSWCLAWPTSAALPGPSPNTCKSQARPWP